MDTGKLDAIDKFGHPFQTWLRRECFKKPTPEAFDLARSAWKEQDKRIAELEDALQRLISVAEQCDGWEFFPSDELDAAQKIARDALEGE